MEEGPQSLIGTVLDSTYTITRLIGEGGMGAVYEAEHKRLPRHFAIKVLYPHVALNSAAVERFNREALITSELGHPHIVDVIDFNHTPDGTLYIVMELLEGEDLDAHLKRVVRMHIPAVSSILEQTASALEAVHKKSIIHRDLKPQNVFLCKREERNDYVKVVDFGISKVRGSQTMLTATNVVIGSPLYMSPEQARGQTFKVDHRTDIYAMGVILYQMLAGEVPFLGETPDAVLYQVVHEDPPSLTALDLDIPASVEDVVFTALAKDPEDRFVSMDELAESFTYATERTVIDMIDSVPTTALNDTDPAPGPPGCPLSFSSIKTDPVTPYSGDVATDSADITPRMPGAPETLESEPGLEHLETIPAEGTPWSRAGERDTFKEHRSMAPQAAALVEAPQPQPQNLDPAPAMQASEMPAAAPPGAMLVAPAVPRAGLAQPAPAPAPRQPPDAVKQTFLISGTELAVRRKNRWLLVSLVLVLAVGVLFGVLGLNQYLGSLEDPDDQLHAAPRKAADSSSPTRRKDEPGSRPYADSTSNAGANSSGTKTDSRSSSAASSSSASTTASRSSSSSASSSTRSNPSAASKSSSSPAPAKKASVASAPTPAASRRNIRVDTDPQGARIYAGKQFLGKTPLRGKKVTTRALTLRVQKWKFRGRAEKIPAGAGELRLEYKLQAAPRRPRGKGTLRVAAMVGRKPVRALVFVDGRRKGETPLRMEVSSGRHKVEVWRGTKSRKSVIVFVKPNKSKTVIIKLRKK